MKNEHSCIKCTRSQGCDVHSIPLTNQQQFGAGSKGGKGLSCSQSKSSSGKPTKEQSGTVSTSASELAELLLQLTYEKWEVFPFPVSFFCWGTKKIAGTRILMQTFPIVCKPTTRQPLYLLSMVWQPKRAFFETSLQAACLQSNGLLLSWDASLSWQWDLLLMTDHRMSQIWVVPELQMDCTPGNSPPEQGHFLRLEIP